MFGRNGDVKGYNCEKVEGLRTVINDTAQKAGSEIPEILRDEIVIPMSTAWYAPEAVTFFEKFREVVKSSGKAITEAFDGFRSAVEQAGTNWAENTNGEIPKLAAIGLVNIDLDVQAILPNNAGNVTIDEGEASKVANSLEQVENEIKDRMKNLASDLDASTAFIGGNQANALETCFETVSGEISNIFKFLSSGDESLKGQINAAVKKYGQVSEGISSAFNSVK